MRGRIAEAGKAVAERRLADAQGILAKCLKELPENPEAHFLLAKIDYEAGNYAKALAHMEAAEGGLAILGDAYGNEQARMRAREEQEASEIQSRMNFIAGGNEGFTGCNTPILSGQLSRYSFLETTKNWTGDTANPFRIPAAYRLVHGNCLGILGRDPQAIAQYRGAVDADPTLDTAWHNLIYLLMKTQDPPGALEALRQADAAKARIDPALRTAVDPPSVPAR